jgi:hypothetical protein
MCRYFDQLRGLHPDGEFINSRYSSKIIHDVESFAVIDLTFGWRFECMRSCI